MYHPLGGGGKKKKNEKNFFFCIKISFFKKIKKKKKFTSEFSKSWHQMKKSAKNGQKRLNTAKKTALWGGKRGKKMKKVCFALKKKIEKKSWKKKKFWRQNFRKVDIRWRNRPKNGQKTAKNGQKRPFWGDRGGKKMKKGVFCIEK